MYSRNRKASTKYRGFFVSLNRVKQQINVGFIVGLNMQLVYLLFKFNNLQSIMAEKQGFEPWDGLTRRRFSKPVLSAAQSPLHFPLTSGSA